MNKNNSAAGGALSADAIALLTADHAKTKKLFAEFEQTKASGTPQQKFDIAKQVCGDILIHLAIEEAIFYPQARQHLNDQKLLDEAEKEHESAKQVIRKLGEIDPADPEFDTNMSSLAQQIEHHVEEEEHELFPRLLQTELDLETLGSELLTAKNDMRIRLGLPPE